MFTKFKEARDQRRLEQVVIALSEAGVILSIQGRFNKAGKPVRYTAEETDESARAVFNLGFASSAAERLGHLKYEDVFMRAARRVASDSELAAFLPARRLTRKHVSALRVHGMNDLAAVLEAGLN